MDFKEGICYVVVRGRDDSSEAYYDLLGEHKHELAMFPEDGLRFIDTVTYLPYNKSIVTENPYLISSYSKHEVFILKNGRWVNPNTQTFGASVEIITNNILGYGTSIALLPYIKLKALVGSNELDGCKTFQDYADKVKKEFSEFKYDEYS